MTGGGACASQYTQRGGHFGGFGSRNYFFFRFVFRKKIEKNRVFSTEDFVGIFFFPRREVVGMVCLTGLFRTVGEGGRALLLIGVSCLLQWLKQETTTFLFVPKGVEGLFR